MVATNFLAGSKALTLFTLSHHQASLSTSALLLAPNKMRSLSLVSALRGGAALVDYSSEVCSYFASIRTPASLIVAASIGALFTDATKPTELKKRNKAERLCIRSYNVCVMLSFMLSLCTIVTSTAAGVMVLHGDFDPLAESAYALLHNEFAFEFMTVRLSYLVSLLTSIGEVTNRALLEYNLLRKGNEDMALTLSFGMGALVLHLWSYINSTLYDSQTLFGMAVTLCSIILRRTLKDHRPLQIGSVACSAIATVFFVRAARKTKLKEDTKKD